MAILVKMRKQTATYWTPGTPDGMGGQSSFGAPVVLAPPDGIRWENRLDLFVNENGEEEQSTAQVYLGQDVVLKGWLFEGTSAASDPRTVSGAREIRGFEKIPNLRVTQYLRRAFL